MTTTPARVLLITLGDPAGIGPEIVVRAIQNGDAANCVVVGDPEVLRRAMDVLDARWPVAVLGAPADLVACPARCIPVLEGGARPGLAALPWGVVDARAGEAAAAWITQAVQAVRHGEAAGVVTAPIHKEALAAAGVPFPGHTEMLQSLAAAAAADGTLPPVRMMLANPELKVVLVTIHVALRRALELLDFDAVLSTLRIADAAARRWGLAAPRIAVAGLNPHAGEGGLFGDEEQRFIGPAIEAARAEGIDAQGPFPPDTVFMRARRGAFDLVVAMTHDHGLIPVKYLGVEDGVNVTLGLPFVRTSPDHGTAFDIAGRGVADPSSLVAAIRMARKLASGG